MIRTVLIAVGAIFALLALSYAGWTQRHLIAAQYEGPAGIAFGEAHAPVRDQTIRFHLWHPTTGGGRQRTIGGNGVFYGTVGGWGAPVPNGTVPLVVISHGAGGNAGQFGWIAEAVAAEGFAVAIPNHPGSTSGNASAEAAVRLWERPPDLSAVIDAIQDDPDLAWIDTDRIAALGFSAGGYTAMAVAGARIDPARLAAFCDRGARGMSDCAFLAAGGVDLHSIDLTPAAQDHRDPRIGALVAIDPGTVETLTEESLAAMALPALVVNLGAEGTVPEPVDASAAAAIMPNARFHRIDDAAHFTFLARCRERGPEILRNEGEPDPLCEDAGGRDRAALHAELAQVIADFLREALAP